MESNLYTELLEEILLLAEEDGATNSDDSKIFIDYVESMLPSNVLHELAQLTGGDSSAFLEDIWNEKYRKREIVDENEDNHESYDDDSSTSASFDNRYCQVCERQVRLTRHHLIPRQTHKTMLKKGITKEILNQTIPICRLCHSTIHRFFTHEELALQFNTIEKLLEDEKFYKFAKWSSSLSNSRYAGSVK